MIPQWRTTNDPRAIREDDQDAAKAIKLTKEALEEDENTDEGEDEKTDEVNS